MTKTSTTGQRNEITLGIMGEKVSNIEKTLEKIDKTIGDLMKKVGDTYATKSELLELKGEVDEIKGNNKWVIKFIIGTVIAAVLALIVKTELLL